MSLTNPTAHSLTQRTPLQRSWGLILITLILALTGCKGEPLLPAPSTAEIFINPPPDTAFGTTTGDVVLSGLSDAVVCYTTDGATPGYDLEQWECQGPSTQRYHAGTPIQLSCNGETGVIFKSVRLFFTWLDPNDSPNRTQEERQASFSLDCGGATAPVDNDGDGIADLSDNCPALANPQQADGDDDGLGDLCDPDLDNDSVTNDADNCPVDKNSDQQDSDKDGIGDICDDFQDFDADGIEDPVDNCPYVANPDQADSDRDNTGDACDNVNNDRDGDTVTNENDNCPDIPNTDQADLDNDGIGDVCDDFSDQDNDSVADHLDNCPLTANPQQLDADQDATGDLCDATPRGPDTDGDNVPDMDDNCPAIANSTQHDSNGNGLGDACEPVAPIAALRDNSARELNIMQTCLTATTGSSEANKAEGIRLEVYIGCLEAQGVNFDPLSKWWVEKVDKHCFGAVNWRIGGIGYHHTPYLNCLRERGINPSRLTVNEEYDNQVYEHCWGDHEGAEEALSWLVWLSTTVMTSFGPGSLPGTIGKVADVAITVTDLGFDIKSATENGGLNLVEITPRALTDFPGYKNCLAERNIPGFDFKPVHRHSFEQLQAWTDLVDDYCYDTVVRDRFTWRASDLRQCYLNREYPEAGVQRDDIIFGDIESIAHETYRYAHSTCRQRFEPHTETSGYMICFRALGVVLKDSDRQWLEPKLKANCAAQFPADQRGRDANGYRDCIELAGASLTTAEETDLANKIAGHCDNSFYVGGRFQSFGPYWKCYSERRTTYRNDAAWQNGVRKYCSDSNMRFNHKSGYQLCLSQREVSYIDSVWRNDVKRYCDNSIYVGGRFKSYGPYFHCFEERGTTFVNDATWQNCVRQYCADSNVRFGQKPGHLTCLNQRQVSFDHNQWCSVVRPFCEGLLLPGNRRNCLVIRECD